jgi:serine protease inhibitor
MSNSNVAPTAAFGLALLKQEVAAKPGENVLISPLSVSLALGMTANGARGTTLKGMTSVLGIESDLGANNKGYAALLELLKRSGIGVTLDIANGIFAKLGVTFKPQFKQANKRYFSAKLEDLDFDDPETLDTINAFVFEGTNKKIDKMLKSISPDAVMFLVNCVYFKGEWTSKFDKTLTKDLPFAGVGDIATMYKDGCLVYSTDWQTYQVIALPFGESKAVREVIILPYEGKTIDDVLAALDADTVTRFAQEDEGSDGELWLPRIDIGFENSLKDSLINLGMEDAFGGADFTGMSEDLDLKIGDVKHRTGFKLDEEGAEGFAATVVEVLTESVSRPFEMKVNRPFIKFTIDKETDAVLFAGGVNNPTLPHNKAQPGAHSEGVCYWLIGLQ